MNAEPIDNSDEDRIDILMRTPRYRKLLHRYWLVSQLRALCADLAKDDALTLERRRTLLATADNLLTLSDETAAEMGRTADEVTHG